MDEIGRFGWFALGVTGMALAAAVHAAAGAGHIPRQLWGPSATVDGAGGSGGARGDGPGGWLLLSAVVLAGGAAYHAAMGTRAIVREILNVTAR
ncbi:hypothetical protein ACWEQL_12430 [Kitasatospora sp. NPDC004240]